MDAKQFTGEPRALISRQALIHNAQVIRKAVGAKTKICAVVKADAYGHGAGIVVDTLCNYTVCEEGMPGDDDAPPSPSPSPSTSSGQALGGRGDGPLVDGFAVATIEQAAQLPATPLPVLVLHPVENTFVGRQRSLLRHAIENGWMLTLCTAAAADDVARVALMAGKQANVQVMVDTGMSRAGVTLEALNHLLQTVQSHASLKLSGIYTHFACSEDIGDSFTAEQMRRFRAGTDGVFRQMTMGRAAKAAAPAKGNGLIRHAANSGAIFFLPVSHMEMVRPGISLYGLDPTGRPSMDRKLRPAMRWTAPLIGIRELPRGGHVGYGRTWEAKRNTRVGLVGIGYGDGYPRALSNKGVMLVRCNGAVKPQAAPVIGRVSMDMTTIDLTEVPEARVGDEVIVLDDDPLSPCSAYELARLAETIPYEIVCGVGPRVKRVAEDVVEEVSMSG